MGCTSSKKEIETFTKRPVKSKSQSRRATTTSISDIGLAYHFSKVLGTKILLSSIYHENIGHGHFGTVRLATPIGKSKPAYAIKTVLKTKMEKDQKLLKRELELLRDLDHPNVIKFHQCYQDSQNYHFVMEYCSGGELMDRLASKKTFNEAEAAKIMAKAFSAVFYLHGRGIVHRDIKPQNFLYQNSEPDAEIKLIDFGLSRYVLPNETLHSQVGTPYYVAPEVLEGKYDLRCDYWSLGVLMYLLLSGHMPFNGANTAELAKAILNKQPSFASKRWQAISPEAKDLILQLLKKDPAERISAKAALSHPWIKKSHKPTQIEHDEAEKVIENLKRFNLKQKFKKEVLSVLVTQLKEAELKKLRDAFKYFDKDGTGRISIADLTHVIREQKLEVTKEQLEQIMKDIHIEESRTIGFSEFMIAAMDSKLYLTRDMLFSAFCHFDVDNSGYIDAKDLKEAMARAAKLMSQAEINEMIVEADISKDGKISFDEFCKLMKVGDVELEREPQDKLMAKTVAISKFRTNSEFFKKPLVGLPAEKPQPAS